MFHFTRKYPGLLLLTLVGWVVLCTSAVAVDKPQVSTDAQSGGVSSDASKPITQSEKSEAGIENILKRGEAALKAKEKIEVDADLVDKSAAVNGAKSAESNVTNNDKKTFIPPASGATQEPRYLFSRDKSKFKEQNNVQLQRATPSGAGSWFIQTLVALAIVLGLIYVLRIVMMRLSGTTPTGASAALIEVLARTPIGPKTQVLFLKMNQRVIVAGQTPAGLNTLATIDEPEDVAWILSQVETANPKSISHSFKRMLGSFDKDFQPDVVSDEAGGDSQEEFVDRTRDEVSGVMSRLKDLQSRISGRGK